MVAVFEMDSMDETPLRMRVPFSKDIQGFPYWCWVEWWEGCIVQCPGGACEPFLGSGSANRLNTLASGLDASCVETTQVVDTQLSV